MIWLGILAAWNMVVFGFYAVDKYKAVRGLWRIPERVLLLESLLLGGVGALLAGEICHHKTRKTYFWLAWILGVAIDAGAVVWIFKLQR
ncbi:MAG: DUF1294 domain-containing protein [Streptococcaceae bacterium]|jgi:uncharacterized membrane protein YsdA (DUF1294 family)|nr:DUF1294 domain-containing protein [Streptococcaceae bacterium]